MGAALSQRQYASEGRLVIEVKDDVCPWNARRFELKASTEESDCRVTEASPDVVMGVSALASTYLGTVTFTTLAAAGWPRSKRPAPWTGPTECSPPSNYPGPPAASNDLLTQNCC